VLEHDAGWVARDVVDLGQAGVGDLRGRGDALRDRLARGGREDLDQDRPLEDRVDRDPCRAGGGVPRAPLDAVAAADRRAGPDLHSSGG
jgi:hypothetical protein